MTSDQFQQLADIYKTMDTAWDKIASLYDFICKGCDENCCQSLFFHHTFIEKAFLLHGFAKLTTETREKVLTRARKYYGKTFSEDSTPLSLKIICPLNENGRCLVYGHRPMICRLHGLPHELHKPGAEVIRGPGCHAGCFDTTPYIPFDRTPFYQKMAQAEIQFRQRTGKTGRIKETVAQMLLF